MYGSGAGQPAPSLYTKGLKPLCDTKTKIHEKALKCKPSALIFGRGRAKELLHVRDDLRKRTR